jgi:hypothetical protein
VFVDVFLQFGGLLLLFIGQLERVHQRRRHQLAGLGPRAEAAKTASAGTTATSGATRPTKATGTWPTGPAVRRPHALSVTTALLRRLFCRPGGELIFRDDSVVVRVRAVECPLHPRVGDLVAGQFAILVLVEHHHARDQRVDRRLVRGCFVRSCTGRCLRAAVTRLGWRLGEGNYSSQTDRNGDGQKLRGRAHEAFPSE